MYPYWADQVREPAGNNTMLMQLMREGVRCHQHESEGNISQMLRSMSKHPGLQAALHQQIADSLMSWRDGLNQLFVTCPFLTNLDLSKCAVVVSGEDYAALTMEAHVEDHLSTSRQTCASSAGLNADSCMHPCASVVINQQALPISIKHLLPILRRLPCLAALHVQLAKVHSSFGAKPWLTVMG